MKPSVRIPKPNYGTIPLPIILLACSLLQACDPALWSAMQAGLDSSQKNQVNGNSRVSQSSYNNNSSSGSPRYSSSETFDKSLNGVSSYYKWSLVNSASNGSHMCYEWQLIVTIKNKSGINKNVSPVTVIHQQSSIYSLPQGWQRHSSVEMLSLGGGWLGVGDAQSNSTTIYTSTSTAPGSPTIMFQVRDN